MKQRGFTLVELLVVIAIIALLAAIIFPVFASVRGKAREAACLSNMRQIGMAFSEYTQDSDDLYPFAVDASDKYANPSLWRFASPTQQAQLAAMLLINPDPKVPNQPGVLTPYIKNHEIWRCPSDTGYDILDNAPDSKMNAYPTSYEAYGSSYLIRTEMAFNDTLYSSAASYTNPHPKPTDPVDPTPPCTEHGPAEVNVLMDAYGGWHGGFLESQKRYNQLMADGHVVSQSRNEYWISWDRLLVQPPDCAGMATP